MIYFDHNAQSPLAPSVVAAMAPWNAPGAVGNSSSPHAAGRRAAAAIAAAREAVARLVRVEPKEVLFTSGGTESNNLALWGAWLSPGRPAGRDRLVIGGVEHASVLEAAKALEAAGVRVTVVPAGPDGVVPVAGLEAALGPDVFLLSLMAVNNVTGMIQPVAAARELTRRAGAWLHTDCVQAPHRVGCDLAALGPELATLASHKLSGPLGVGALVVREGFPLAPLMRGGAHERGLRPGTMPVGLVVGMGAAYARLAVEGERDRATLRELDARFLAGLGGFPRIRLRGAREGRAPGVFQLGFPGLEGEPLIIGLDLEGVCVAVGSTCSSGALGATGPGAEADLEGAFRVSLGATNTGDEIDRFFALLPGVIRRVAARAPGGAGWR